MLSSVSIQPFVASTAVEAVTLVRLKRRVRYGPDADEAAAALSGIPAEIAIVTKDNAQASATADGLRAVRAWRMIVLPSCTHRLRQRYEQHDCTRPPRVQVRRPPARPRLRQSARHALGTLRSRVCVVGPS